VSKVNLVCGKTRVKVILRSRETRVTRDYSIELGHARVSKVDRCSGTSKVNPVYGKMAVNRKLRSRETRLSILNTRNTNLRRVKIGDW
jgi:hypothetical protein